MNPIIITSLKMRVTAKKYKTQKRKELGKFQLSQAHENSVVFVVIFRIKSVPVTLVLATFVLVNVIEPHKFNSSRDIVNSGLVIC